MTFDPQVIPALMRKMEKHLPTTNVEPRWITGTGSRRGHNQLPTTTISSGNSRPLLTMIDAFDDEVRPETFFDAENVTEEMHLMFGPTGWDHALVFEMQNGLIASHISYHGWESEKVTPTFSRMYLTYGRGLKLTDRAPYKLMNPHRKDSDDDAT